MTVEAVLFDTFGTVVDWRTGIAAAVAEQSKRRGFRRTARCSR